MVYSGIKIFSDYVDCLSQISLENINILFIMNVNILFREFNCTVFQERHTDDRITCKIFDNMERVFSAILAFFVNNSKKTSLVS